MQDFFLIRHGETDWNIKLGKLQGHTDIPLNNKGILQARALSDLVRDLHIHKVISSDLQRAWQTASHLWNCDPQHIEKSPLLREVHLGIGEGLTWDEVIQKLGADFRARWSENREIHLDLRFPDGESRREVISRVKSYLLEQLQNHSGQTLAFVTHGYVIRSMVFHLSSIETNFFVPNCAVVPFGFQEGRLIYKGPQTTDKLLQPRIAD